MPILPIVLLILLVSVWLIFAIAHHRSAEVESNRPHKKTVYNPDTGEFSTTTMKKSFVPLSKSTPKRTADETRTATFDDGKADDKTAPAVGEMLRNIYVAHFVGYTLLGILTEALSTDIVMGLGAMALWIGTLVFVLRCLIRSPQGARKSYAVWFALVMMIAPYALIIVLPCSLIGGVISIFLML